MGLYDEGTYDNQYTEEREDARTQLARKLAEREQKMQGYMADQQYQSDTTYGDDMAKGAMMGAGFGPWGALAGAAAGRLTGGIKSFGARRDAGEGTAGAFFNSFLNPVETLKQLPSAFDSPSAAPLAATMSNQYQQHMAQQADPMNYSSQGTSKDPFGNDVEQFRFQDPDEEIPGT